MNKSLIIICIVSALFAFSWLTKGRVNIDELSLYTVYVQAVDPETNEPINISVRHTGTEINEKRRIRGLAGVVDIEMTSGIVRASWIDLKESSGTLILSAEGYGDTRISMELRNQVSRYQVSSGLKTPDIIKLTKAQPVDGGQ
jgi:hypothetical protein